VSGIVAVGGEKTAGSFMSFQIPAMPMSVNILKRPPHHSRAAGLLKSGKTLGCGFFSAWAGHTGASNTDPSAFFTKWPPRRPLS